MLLHLEYLLERERHCRVNVLVFIAPFLVLTGYVEASFPHPDPDKSAERCSA